MAITQMHEKNEFYLSGVLSPQSKIAVATTGPGRSMTSFILSVRLQTPDGEGRTVDYPVSAVGDRREVVESVGTGRILVSGYIREGKYGPFCLGIDVEVQEREEWDKARFEVVGRLFGKFRVRSTNQGALTDFILRVHRYSGWKKKFDTISIPTYGDRTKQMEAMTAMSGDRVQITGPIVAGKHWPYPRGLKVEVDVTSQKWRTTGFGL